MRKKLKISGLRLFKFVKEENVVEKHVINVLFKDVQLYPY
jgi:hypothetical protein